MATTVHGSSATRPAPKRPAAGLASASLAVTLWSLGNVLAKLIALPGPSLAFERLWLGAASSFVICLVFGRKLRWSDLRTAVPGGVIFGMNSVLFFSAVKLTSVTDATIITTLQPALLMGVAGPLFGEKVSRRDVMGALVAFAGAVVVVIAPGGGGRSKVAGDLLAVGALVTWAGYFVASKKARRSLGTLEYQASLQTIAALVVTPVALLSGGTLAGHASTWGWVVVVVIGPGGGHYLMNWAHEHITLTQASLLTLASPVLAMFLALAILGAPVTRFQLLGTAIVLAALAWVVVRRAPSTGVEPLEPPPSPTATPSPIVN